MRVRSLGSSVGGLRGVDVEEAGNVIWGVRIGVWVEGGFNVIVAVGRTGVGFPARNQFMAVVSDLKNSIIISATLLIPS